MKSSVQRDKMLRRAIQRVQADSTLLFNTGSLVCTLVVTSALGFVYWWFAARHFSLEIVGLASAAISAMSLLATFCLLGLGTLLITELPRNKGEEASLVSTALIVVGVVGGCAGALFAIVAPLVSPEFRPLLTNFLDIWLFAIGVSLTAITLLLDQVFIALLQGVVVLVRNSIWSIIKLIALFVTSVWFARASGLTIYATWAIGNLVSFLPLIGLVIWKREKFGRTFAPQWGLLRKLGRTALLHHLLNLIVQAPTLVLPIIVTVLLSAKVNAWFYIASLIVTFLFAISISFTVVLHATNATEPLVLRQKVRLTMGVATLVSIVVGGILLVGGQLVLDLFGPGYAEHALWSLRILTFGAFPLMIKNHYLAISRIKKLIAQAIVPITIGALLELGIAALGAHLGGLSGLSAGWVTAMYIESLFMFPLVYRAMTYKPLTAPEPETANYDPDEQTLFDSQARS